MYKVLITGDRNWTDRDKIKRRILKLSRIQNDLVIIEGEARGADKMAREICEEFNIKFKPYPADWDKHKKAAGTIRNSTMLSDNPDIQLVMAFHSDLFNNSKGTLDMVKRSHKAGKSVLIIA